MVSNSFIKPFKTVFLDLISKLESVQSVCIGFKTVVGFRNDDFYLTDVDFAKEWLPRVSGSLKSLSIYDRGGKRPRNVFPLISAYCHNLVNLKLDYACFSLHNMNLMPMLTSLTLTCTRLKDRHLNNFNKCFPNLQILNLEAVVGLKDPKIHHLNIHTCLWVVDDNPSSLTLITPNLITLTIDCCFNLPPLLVEAPMLSYFYLCGGDVESAGALTAKKFENLKTVWFESLYTCYLLSEFPITKTVEDLTLESGNCRSAPKLTLGKVFKVFPNVSSLCINSGAWSEIEDCLDPEGWEILDGSKGLKTIRAYLMLVDPSLTFSSVACVLDQCVGLLEVSLLVHTDVDDTVSKSFMSKCVARWPGLTWRWGIWNEDKEDSWITNATTK